VEIVVICKQGLVAIRCFISPRISNLVLNLSIHQLSRLVVLDSLNIDDHLLDCLLQQKLIVRLVQLAGLPELFGRLHLLDGHCSVSVVPHEVGHGSDRWSLDLCLRLVDLTEKVIREENVDLIDEKDLGTRRGLALNCNFGIRVFQDQIQYNVSQLTVLVNLHFTDLIECAILNAVFQLKLTEHARECVVITLAKVDTVAGATDVKVAKSEDDGEHSQGDTLPFTCLDLH